MLSFLVWADEEGHYSTLVPFSLKNFNFDPNQMAKMAVCYDVTYTKIDKNGPGLSFGWL